jgi:hypothetical protein
MFGTAFYFTCLSRDLHVMAAAAQQLVEGAYHARCCCPSDINEHLPTLALYASRCSVVAEFGVRHIVSTWALLKGLLDPRSPAGRKALYCVDLYEDPGMRGVVESLHGVVEVAFIAADTASACLPEPVDMLFIDTWHVYGHLRPELAAHASLVKRYIVLHDTEIDGQHGESVRHGDDLMEVMAQHPGYTYEDVSQGLGRAVQEFLQAHEGEWQVEQTWTNNNGLTVLARTGQTHV